MLVVLTETVKDEEPHVEVELIELIDFVWRHGEVWSYGGAVVVDQKAEGKYEVTVEELMAEL
ncbi:unnamed protein product [Brassica oleracea]|uniref:Uncharacterized protein n=1 Tax=Brassica oleracea TaxID=3712 RepID=A0A3P6GTA9_BRAOL|nr:unnamed protein product [Brassica oleracea]